MTTEKIIEGSKRIAEYMDLMYIPSNDLKGFPKAGWFETVPLTPEIKEVTQTSRQDGKEDEISVIQVDIKLFRYHSKNGWGKNDDYYYRFVCRKHSDLRYYNSMDALIYVMEKIEKHNKGKFFLHNGGCEYIANSFTDAWYFDKEYTWIQNTFKVIVDFLSEKEIK